MKIIEQLLFAGILFLLPSCKEFIDIDPPETQLISETVFEDDITANATIAGLYSQMALGSGTSSLAFLGGLSSDELIPSSNNQDIVEFYENEITPTNGNISTLWNTSYTNIYFANSILEGLEKSTNISDSIKRQLIGEAKFVRAFCHFYLVNLFGDVPYIRTTDYSLNTIASQTPSTLSYQYIIEDLTEAKDLLSGDYSYSKGERVRPNRWVAAAFLARVHLYLEDWLNAEIQASEVIDNSTMYGLGDDLTKIFLKNSKETILQLIPGSQTYTNEGNIFVQPSSSSYATISSDLYNAFEIGDLRKDAWINTGTNGTVTWDYPYKYKQRSSNGTGTEYVMILRLAEQYLIRAEARAQQKKLFGDQSAESDINIIRNRAGLENTTASNQLELLVAIEKERRLELFTEWGHRWFDLKRTDRSNIVMSSIKTGWQSTDVLYPIPESEVLINHNLKQNLGY